MNERSLVYEARQAVYAVFQRLYAAAPDRALLDWLVTEQPFAEFPVTLDAEADAARQRVAASCPQLTLQALADDFHQLYIGYGAMQAPPWESVYRNEEHTLFDIHTLQVRETYARHGMEFIHKNKMPEDSISIELEFMKTLTDRLLTALEKGDGRAERILLNEQLKFLQEHLLVWVPEFVALSEKHAQTPFYGNLGGVLLGFLRWDQEVLRELVALFPVETGLDLS